MKNEMKYLVEDNIYARNKKEMVVKGADATPEEVRLFFEKHQGELPVSQPGWKSLSGSHQGVPAGNECRSRL